MKPIRSVANVAVYPSAVAHELTHAAVAVAWAERMDIDLHPLAGGYGVNIQWRDDVERWQIALVSLAPFIAGMVALAVTLVLWVAGGAGLPTSGTGLAKLSIVAMWWVLYVVPSSADVGAAINGGERKDERVD